MLRLRPWLHAAIALYLLGAIFLVTLHQHHSALHNTDCALCAMSHTPAVVATAAELAGGHTTEGTLVAIPDDRGWAEESYQASRSRAPPQS
jgi:hypothetical protein